MNKKQRWALVTGAAGGIGRALVSEFVDAGYQVIAADSVWNASQMRSDTVYELKLDLIHLVDKPGALTELDDQVKTITRGIGISALINNAAVQILADTQSLSIEQWQTTWNVNLHAPFLLVQQFLCSLAANNGAVVNISSIHATQTKKKFVAYATSKAALSSLTKNLAVDIGEQIRVNAIEPAAVATDMLIAGFSDNPQEFNALGKYHPTGRIAEPKEIAELAVFLCSEKSRFIHGECIKVSGGIHGCLSDPSVD